MLDKPLSALTKIDIDDLIASGRMEDRRIEYKRSLPGNSDAEKKEFLADVSAFANALGGDILYGVVEEKGAPVEATGIASNDTDGTKLRLQNILESNLDPRLPSYALAAVNGFRDGAVIVLRVDSSWRAPHMVTYSGSRRFYVRRDAQKVEMDVTDLRAAFVGSESLANRIRAFRDERLTNILAGTSPMGSAMLPTTVLHIVPVGAAFLAADVDPRRASPAWQHLNKENGPLQFVYSADVRPNLDGLLLYSRYYEPRVDASPAYVQVFRNGGVEFAEGHDDRRVSDTLTAAPYLDGGSLESTVLHTFKNYGAFRDAIGIGGPVLVMLSLVRVRSVPFFAGERSGLRGLTTQHQFDRDVIVLPEVLVDSFSDASQQLRPERD